MGTSMRRFILLPLLGLTIASVGYMWSGHQPADLPSPSAEIDDIALRLATHVQALAGTIGPRHAHRPQALDAAARYVEEALLQHQYVVERQPFRAAGTTVSNIEA